MTRFPHHPSLACSLLVVCLAAVSASRGWSAEDAQRGKVVYEKHCAGCHGKTGSGLGGATPSLTDRARMAAQSDADLFRTVTEGRPGTGMPAWGKVLSESDRWNVVSYLRMLASPSP